MDRSTEERALSESSGGALDHVSADVLEAASLRAWPAIEEVDFDGWKLRCSEGFTGRANSVQALSAAVADGPLSERVAYCERWYEQRDRPPLFRMTPFSTPGLDDVLGARGYERFNPTRVLVRASEGLADRSERLALRAADLHDWLRAYATLTGIPAAPAPMRRIIEKSPGRSFPGVLWTERPRRAVACGLAVLDGAFLGLFDLVVDPAQRRRGYGDELVRRLVVWGRERGAEHVYLQVTEDNVPALALYGKLGFRRVYDYWYRRRSS